MDLLSLNQNLQEYDNQVMADLEPILEDIAKQSKALASNLKACLTDIAKTDRYLRACRGEFVGMEEKDFSEEEFQIFRKYVRLLRSCTIMCGNDLSARYKRIFLDYFSGKRLKLAKELGVN